MSSRDVRYRSLISRYAMSLASADPVLNVAIGNHWVHGATAVTAQRAPSGNGTPFGSTASSLLHVHGVSGDVSRVL
eukprot:1562678-Prymnesium_polylepis.3